MSANCPECHALVLKPESEQIFPSVVNPRGNDVMRAKVLTYTCECGHTFTTIAYLPQ